MKTIDFTRSFLTFRIDTLKKPSLTTSHKPPYALNSARIQLECCCEVRDKRTGATQQFVLGASCKTEFVGVERGIWTQPNADFVPILSRDRFLNLKTFDRADREVMLYPPSLGVQPDRQTGNVADAFDRISIDICRCEGELLETTDEIIETTLANCPVVAQTELEGERYAVLIEYPVKTMNANERDAVYQTDTGPILFPDLSREPEDLISGLELAFAAFNCPTWTEFILRAKAPVAEGVNVYHYCKPVRFDCKNQVIRLGC
jgi:hypothetical protein